MPSLFSRSLFCKIKTVPFRLDVSPGEKLFSSLVFSDKCRCLLTDPLAGLSRVPSEMFTCFGFFVLCVIPACEGCFPQARLSPKRPLSFALNTLPVRSHPWLHSPCPREFPVADFGLKRATYSSFWCAYRAETSVDCFFLGVM